MLANTLVPSYYETTAKGHPGALDARHVTANSLAMVTKKNSRTSFAVLMIHKLFKYANMN